MAVQKEHFGNMPDGQEVFKYTLTNKEGVSASFITLGAVWVSMAVPDREGRMADVVLGYDDVESYLQNPAHFGAPIGRNANRIGGAVITIDGVDYKLAANNGPNNLHSGPDLYHARLWECREADSAEGDRLDFFLESPDGDQGYPGNAKICVSYTLTEDSRLLLDYHMVSDKDTVANFTNHSYFKPGGTRQRRGSGPGGLAECICLHPGGCGFHSHWGDCTSSGYAHGFHADEAYRQGYRGLF